MISAHFSIGESRRVNWIANIAMTTFYHLFCNLMPVLKWARVTASPWPVTHWRELNTLPVSISVPRSHRWRIHARRESTFSREVRGHCVYYSTTACALETFHGSSTEFGSRATSGTGAWKCLRNKGELLNCKSWWYVLLFLFLNFVYYLFSPLTNVLLYLDVYINCNGINIMFASLLVFDFFFY